MRLKQLDKKYLWHPFTQQSEWEKEFCENPLVIKKGRGIYLYDSNGKRYIDGVSSLWTNVHGHRNRFLDLAIQRQLKKVAHTTFLGLTHEPGIRLAEAIIRIAPKNLRRVFYSDNGSTAVEVALKMAFQYHTQLSRTIRHSSSTFYSKKTEFLALKNSYHGDTVGSVSVGGIDLFHKKFGPLLFKTHFAISPHCSSCPYKRIQNQPKAQSYQYHGEKPKPGDFRKETGCYWECLGEVKTILERGQPRIAAAIIEPIVQGAGGILVMPPGYLWGFARLCRQYNILFIADEVAVGFGRTGKMFACEHEDVQPDFLCLAKGLSGGYLPLAATLTTEKIYRAFLGKHEEFKTFFHGHTYTANPLACAVGRENLKIFEREELVRKVEKISTILKNSLSELLSLPLIKNIRQAGLIAGIELRSFPLSDRAGKRICMEARKEGLLVRPLGDLIVLMPPLSIKEREVRRMVLQLKKAIQSFSNSVHPSTGSR